MKKILLVDDEIEILELVETLLLGELSCEVIKAESGNQAVELLESDISIDIIISDYTMPNGNGAILYNHNKNQKNRVPFAFLTGGFLEDYTDLEGFDEASNLDYFLSKPIDTEILLETVETMFSMTGNLKSNDLTYQEKEEGYRRIKINIFKKHIKGNIAVYVKLSENKFLKLFSEDDLLSETDFEKYEKKGGDYLYLRASDYQKITNQMTLSINEKLNQASDAESAISATSDALSYFYEGFHQFGVSDQQIALVSKSVEVCKEKFFNNKDLKGLLEKFLAGQGYLVSHSMITLHISYMIADELGHANHLTLDKLSYASLLHDITLKEPTFSEILNKDDKKFKNLDSMGKQHVLYHPEEGAKLVEGMKDLPQDVYHIIYEHHERPDGGGFPRGLQATRVNPLSALFILALRTADHIYYNQFNGLADLKTTFLNDYNKGNFKKPLDALLKRF